MVTARGLSYRYVRSEFMDRLEQVEADTWIWRVARRITTDQWTEIQRWLGHPGSMQLEKGGNVTQDLNAYQMNLSVRAYRNQAEANSDDIRMDKTDSLITRLREIAEDAAIFPQRQLVASMVANGLAYDGVAMFGDRSSSVAGGQKKNVMVAGDGGAAAVMNVTTPASPTSAEMQAIIFAMLNRLMTMKNDAGGYMNYAAREFLLVVPLNMLQSAIAALETVYTSAGVDNQLSRLVSKRGYMIDVVGDAFVGEEAGVDLYLFRTDTEMPAFAWVEQEFDGSPIMLRELGLGSEFEIENTRVRYIVRRICDAAYGRPERVVKATLS